MKIVSAEDMRLMEQWTVQQRHLPELLLMENAGRAVAHYAWKKTSPDNRQVVVVAGVGNNGGDALAAARHLHQWGADVRLFLLGEADTLSDSARQNWRFLEHSELRWYMLKDQNSFYPFKLCLETAAAAVDGVFGSGLNRFVEGVPLQVVQALNKGRAPVISIDLPSGVDANTGHLHGEAVQASLTVALGYPKQGLFLFPGREKAGEIVTADISLPKEAEKLLKQPAQWVDETYACSLLPQLARDQHKGSFGHILAWAGSRGMMGAAWLAARGALRSGAGLVSVGVNEPLADAFDLSLPEAMTLALPAMEQRISLDAAEVLQEALKDKAVFLLGSGLERHEAVGIIMEQLLSQNDLPAILDAGALWALSENPQLAQSSGRGPWVLTPHPGELALLLGTTSATVQMDRPAAVRHAAKTFNSTVILKGAGTIVAQPDGSMWINGSGNVALAVAGSGDVLAGTVAAWIAQGLKPLEAALLGAYMHGAAGDLLQQEMGPRGILAREIADTLPRVRQRLEALRR